AWWDEIPKNGLTDSLAKLKEAVPAEQAIFDALPVKEDVGRYKVYEQLGAKLPELARKPAAREPLRHLVAGCCALEPSDLNVAPLQRALVGQLPRDAARFRPEEKEYEVERACYWLQVVLDAVRHPAARAGRARALAQEMGKAFDFSLDGAPPDEFEAQSERLLAARCFRN